MCDRFITKMLLGSQSDGLNIMCGESNTRRDHFAGPKGSGAIECANRRVADCVCLVEDDSEQKDYAYLTTPQRRTEGINLRFGFDKKGKDKQRRRPTAGSRY
jgi:hypothetical protein